MDECEQTLKRIRSIEKWLKAELYSVDWMLKIKDDIQYYMQLAARLEKRIEVLEKKINGL